MPTVSLFEGLSRATAAALTKLARPATFRAHEALFKRGDEPRRIFAIVSGRVKIWRMTADGAMSTLLVVGPDDVVGSLAVVRTTPHPVTATALDDVEALAWASAGFTALLAQDAGLAGRMLQLVATRAEQMIDRAEELISVPLEQRLARILLRLVADGGRECASDAIRLRIMRQELADLASVTLPTISRVMGRWRREGMIAGSRGQVDVVDLGRLADIAGRADAMAR